ncbi:hypothetical protein ACU686_35865 [Yinghuangia aomiensis]
MTYWPFQPAADRCTSPEAEDRGPRLHIASAGRSCPLVSCLAAFLFGYALLEMSRSAACACPALSEA